MIRRCGKSTTTATDTGENVGAIWPFQLIVSPIWLKYYRFGPLEWVWRSLTYIKLQPMRRKTIVEVAAAG